MEDVEAQFDDNITVIERMEGENSTVEIEEYDELRGRPNVMTDTNSLQTYKKLGIKLQRIKITLHGDGGFRCRQGALHYMIGDIDITAKNKIKGKIKPRFHGDGVAYLEPEFSNYQLIKVDGTIIIDRGLWWCSEDTLTVKRTTQKNFSSAVFGGEGFFQTKLTGSGWAVIEIPVPPQEVQKLTLRGEKLKVDGPFAILRDGDVEFTVTSSNKGFGKLTDATGEGMLQTFQGHGDVWLLPTVDYYPVLGGFLK
eukprot:TRINITY_DN1278_c0_g1_i1.p1 TRINITY_DN1278_c0_g1~~TRINITY_DN1278_c0_g1_i1.p1  ORF type:complete len:253 (-),score=54.50 TRINITY_DN1278_c0_g1_i1:27-785(-)